MRILLTGAGSLIARSVLDCLAGRRENLWVVGANLDGRDATARRCDELHGLPPDTDADFAPALVELVDRVDPDLVIPCRDPHIQVLSQLRAEGRIKHPTLVGPPELAGVMSDKWLSYQWSVAHSIPFGETVLCGTPDSTDAAQRLLADHGWPLIAKPRHGSGSLGVRVICNGSQLAAAVATADHVLQPFYDPPTPAELQLDTSAGLPLFWEVPVPRQYGAQTLIGPRGQVGPHLIVRAQMRVGRVESQQRFADEDLRAVALSAAKVLAEAGWRGPMNVQARPTQTGWRIIEYGGRFTGGTSARLHLGLDEVGWTLNEWAGREIVPPPSYPTVDLVRRYLTDSPVGQPQGAPGGTTAGARLA